MMNKPLSGIFEATLEEDFIDTVRSTKFPYCKAMIPRFYDKAKEYPFTFVPAWFRVLPLKKGDKINVTFLGGDIQYPKIFSTSAEIPASVLEEYKEPSPGSKVKAPSIGKSFAFDYYSSDIYTLYQDSVVITHNKNTVVFQSADEVVVFAKKTGILSEEIIHELKGSGTYSLLNSAENLKGLVDSILDTISSLTTLGNDTTQAASPATVAAVAALKLRVALLLK